MSDINANEPFRYRTELCLRFMGLTKCWTWECIRQHVEALQWSHIRGLLSDDDEALLARTSKLLALAFQNHNLLIDIKNDEAESLERASRQAIAFRQTSDFIHKQQHPMFTREELETAK